MLHTYHLNTLIYTMEPATLVAIFLSCLLVSFTAYSLYTAFGQPSKQLRDPFKEHED
jgi:PsbN protein